MNQEPEPEEHPLFPVEGDEEIPEINTVIVTRLNRTSGKYEYCRRDFPATALTSLDELYESFGGGTYRLFGRGRQPGNPDSRPNARIRAQADYDLPGPSKPLNEDEPSGSPRAVGPAPVAPPAGDLGLGQAGGILTLLLGMMNNQHAAAMAAQKHSSDILLAMMNNSRGDGDKLITVLQTLNQNHAEQMAKLYSVMLQAKGGEGGSVDGALSAIQTGIDLAKGAQPEPGGSEPNELGSVVQGLMAAVELSKMSGGAPPAIPPNGGVGGA